MNRQHISWNVVYLWYYQIFNSLALGGCGNNSISVISEPRTRLMVCQNIVSGNSMVPAGNKPLPVAMLAQLSVGRMQQATRGLDMIYHIICDLMHTRTPTPILQTTKQIDICMIYETLNIFSEYHVFQVLKRLRYLVVWGWSVSGKVKRVCIAFTLSTLRGLNKMADIVPMTFLNCIFCRKLAYCCSN